MTEAKIKAAVSDVIETWYYSRYKIMQLLPETRYVAVFYDNDNNSFYSEALSHVAVAVVKVFEITGVKGKRADEKKVVEVYREIVGVMFCPHDMEFLVVNELTNFCGLSVVGTVLGEPPTNCLVHSDHNKSAFLHTGPFTVPPPKE